MSNTSGSGGPAIAIDAPATSAGGSASRLRLGSYLPADETLLPVGWTAAPVSGEVAASSGIFLRTNGAFLVKVADGAVWSFDNGLSADVGAATSGGTADARLAAPEGLATVASLGTLMVAATDADQPSTAATIFDESKNPSETTGDNVVAIGGRGTVTLSAPTTSVETDAIEYTPHKYDIDAKYMQLIAYGSYFQVIKGINLNCYAAGFLTAGPSTMVFAVFNLSVFGLATEHGLHDVSVAASRAFIVLQKKTEAGGTKVSCRFVSFREEAAKEEETQARIRRGILNSADTQLATVLSNFQMHIRGNAVEN